MCDTVVVLGNSSEDGIVIFGKNSDRDPNEAHAIYYIPRTVHKAAEVVHCQYLDVPQVDGTTYAVILSKPAWFTIGCEMGANEYGVVMGNEAVFSKEPYEGDNVLLGMDLMTLALQRAQSAQEALTVITALLTKYGQGGVSSRADPHMVQHNSYIIADLTEAWVLETANKFWVAKKVQDVASISNGYTIGSKWDRASPGLVENAIEKGWCDSKAEFNFADCYSDPEKRILSGCLARQGTTINGLRDNKGIISVSTVMKLLRSHDSYPFHPDKATMSSVCQHYSSLSISQTTGSYVAHLAKELQTHWLTGTSATCLSLYKPFFFESPEQLQHITHPALKNDNTSLWWTHERLHRLALRDYKNRAPNIIKESGELEQELIQAVNELKSEILAQDINELTSKMRAISSEALEKNTQLINRLLDTISKIEIEKPPRKAYTKFWDSLSKKDELDLN
jgi:secernin